MRTLTRQQYEGLDPRREASQVTWPNAQDAAGVFAAAGVDSAMGGPPGVPDGGFPWGSGSGDFGALFPGASADWGQMGSAAFGDFMALYPGAQFDNGQLLIPFGPDSVTPAYLTLDASGNVGAEFTGKVKAKGLELSADVVAAVANSIRWIRDSDGFVAVRQDGSLTAGGSTDWRSTVVAPSGNRGAAIILDAGDPGLGQADVSAQTTFGANTFNRRVLDKEGKSSFAGRGQFHAYNSDAAATVPGASVYGKIKLNSEAFDIEGWFDTVNWRYTPQIPGYYLIMAVISLAANIPDTQMLAAQIRKNGAATEYRRLFRIELASADVAWDGGACLVEANGTTDFFELFATQSDAAARLIGAGEGLTWMAGMYVGSNV